MQLAGYDLVFLISQNQNSPGSQMDNQGQAHDALKPGGVEMLFKKRGSADPFSFVCSGDRFVVAKYPADDPGIDVKLPALQVFAPKDGLIPSFQGVAMTQLIPGRKETIIEISAFRQGLQEIFQKSRPSGIGVPQGVKGLDKRIKTLFLFRSFLVFKLLAKDFDELNKLMQDFLIFGAEGIRFFAVQTQGPLPIGQGTAHKGLDHGFSFLGVIAQAIAFAVKIIDQQGLIVA